MIKTTLTRIDAALSRLALARRGWGVVFVALLSLMLSLPGFFDLPAVDRDESRFSQATKQMVETGDYIDIRLGDQTRYKKPVGIYWLQSIPVRILGPELAREIWVYRLPALTGAMLASVLTYLIAATLVGPKPALLAGGLMAATLVLGAEARQAKTDAALLASILAAQYVLARLWMQGGDAIRKTWPWLFWAGLGASMLIKGPIGVMVVGLTAAGLSVLRRDLRWLLPLRFGPGLALFAVIVLPWYVLITLKAGSAFWAESLGQDMLGKVTEGQEGHGAPPGTYLLLAWVTFWPAALILPFGIAYAWREKLTPAVQFCLAWIVPFWLIFEIVATKLPHYTLPTYPALAVLTAAGWLARPQNSRPGWPHAVLIVVLLLIGAALTIVPVAASLTISIGPSLIWALGAVLVLLGGLASWYALRAGQGMAPLIGMALMSAGLGFAFYGHLGQVQYLWPAKQLARIEADQQMCDEAVLASIGYHEPSLQLQSRLRPVLTHAPQAAEIARTADCALIYVAAPERDAFLDALPDAPAAIAVVEGMNLGTGREQMIEVYRFD